MRVVSCHHVRHVSSTHCATNLLKPGIFQCHHLHSIKSLLPVSPRDITSPPTNLTMSSSSSTYPSTTSPHALSVLTIVVYVILILPTFYVWRRHGRPGFLAYNFVYAFCAIRITGSALSIAAERDASLETAAAIVNSIAISPLLLAALGVLHEARSARIADLHAKREWRGVWCLHTIVTTGMVLVIVGIVKVVEDGSSTAESVVTKTGMGVLVAAYVILLLWTMISARQPFLTRNETLADGTIVSFFSFLASTSLACASSMLTGENSCCIIH